MTTQGDGKRRARMGAMTAVGIGLLVLTVAAAIASGGPTVRTYVIAALAVALLIGGRIIDAIHSR